MSKQAYLFRLIVPLVVLNILTFLGYWLEPAGVARLCPELKRYLDLISISIDTGNAIMGSILLYLLARPVTGALGRLEELSDAELEHVARRNLHMPDLAMLVMMLCGLILIIGEWTLHRAGGETQIIVLTKVPLQDTASMLIFPLLLRLFCLSPTNQAFREVYAEYRRRGLIWQLKDFPLGSQLIILCIAISTAAVLFITGVCANYTATSGQKEALRGMEEIHGYVLNRLDRGPATLADLKPHIDALNAAGQSLYAVASRGGELIYNPRALALYNTRWQSMNHIIRAGMQGQERFTGFDMVQGQVFCISAINPNLSLVSIYSIAQHSKNITGIIGYALSNCILIIILVIFVARAMLNIISRPLGSLTERMDDLAAGEGDLTQRLSVNSADEIGRLSINTNRFIEKLERIMINVKETAMRVEGATQEVQAGSQGLSTATQQQASAIEEVAATIDEMTSSIKNTAANAEHGREQTREIVGLAGEGSDIARGLVQAMNEIKGSSRKIGEITSTVNEVAFQTNLLALNAAVEAARAGQHGKGFAVVAEEVRSLAQKSAQSANEIKVLIEDSLQKVDVGDRMVKETDTSLGKIAKSMDNLSRTIEDITAASNEQAVGVVEVNRAVSQIDMGTQQNASTVEELASTADALNNEARELGDLVLQFKVTKE